MGCRKTKFEHLVLRCDMWIRDEVVPKEQAVPVLLELRLNHVDVVGPDPSEWIATNEPRIERGPVVAGGRTPEVVVALGFESRSDDSPCFRKVCHLREDVDDRLGGEAGYGGAAEVLDPPKKAGRKRGEKVLLLSSK